MASATYLNDFPKHVRGTYRLSDDRTGDESMGKKLAFAKDLVKSIADENEITILLHCSSRNGGWVLMWWPANEPRHEEFDEIITPGVNNG